MRLAILLSLLTWIASAQTTAPVVQLAAGIAKEEKEEVDGNLKAAVEIHKKIADDSSAGRDIRSKALVPVAGCYEKLGGKAKHVYEQVIREYADSPLRHKLATGGLQLRSRNIPPPGDDDGAQNRIVGHRGGGCR